jgi:ATP-dependent helicase/nuclease subunit B
LGAGSSAAALEDFEALRRHVRGKIVELCENMLKGNIAISPYRKKKETPCEYCSYKSVCRFDVTIRENNYRVIRDKDKDEIWKAIRQGKEAGA